MARDDRALEQAIDAAAVRLEGELNDYDPLLEQIGDAQLVLIGEATHGTQEFYRERAFITRRLIAEKGFCAVAVEADWPDAWRVNRFARGLSDDETPTQALEGFARFPTWMWRNKEVAAFVEWLRDFNDAHHEPWSAVGFYGLDLYSLHASAKAVIDYLEGVDLAAARRARARYGCFEHTGHDVHRYGQTASWDPEASCEQEVVDQLVELQEARSRYLEREGGLAEDAFFHAEQNARLARSAEAYYRTMYRAGAASWNLRDEHMAQTLEALLHHLGERIERPRIVVWAHNSHLGDARHTSMGRAGELNLGQLVRMKHQAEAVLIGFTTYDGHVTAAQDWDEPAERRRVRPALDHSYERLFHRTRIPRFHLSLRELGEALGGLYEERLERAIGVVYRPETERWSHYFECNLPRQFDQVLHIDRTAAVEPLERTPSWETGEPPETFPTAL